MMPLKFDEKKRKIIIDINQPTYMTMAEFFIIRPHGPNCCIGLGAFKLLVLL